MLCRRLRHRWSAERLLPAEFEAPELFTGEHVFPWIFEDYGALRRCARRPAPGRLRVAERSTTPSVLQERGSGRGRRYANDMYVEREFSEETAGRSAARAWVTNEYEHNGLRADGEKVLGHLLELARSRA